MQKRLLLYTIGVRLTRLMLRGLGFATTITLLSRFPSRRTPAMSTGDAIAWAGVIERVSGRPIGASCLDRSVFLWFIMRRRDVPGIIRIGVIDDAGEIHGHAWVEADGVVVNDDPGVAGRFAVFPEDPVGLVFS